MPSKSPEQARLMRAVANGWKKPGGGGPTREVATKFVNADRRSKVQGYSDGGVAPRPGTFGRVAGPLSRDPRMMGVAGPQRLQRGQPQMGGRQQQMGMYGRGPRGPRAQIPRGPRAQIPRGGGPVGGGLSQAYSQMADPKQIRRITPPPMKNPADDGRFVGGAGGNPMTGGRNPIMRQMRGMNRSMMGGRGPTGYLR